MLHVCFIPNKTVCHFFSEKDHKASTDYKQTDYLWYYIPTAMQTAAITHNRLPAVAGQFYPAKAELLERTVSSLFRTAIPKKCTHVRAIISPHAGYDYSGQVAASAFNQVENNYKRIFILGSSHQVYFQGASVYCTGDYRMPFGRVVVDTEVGKQLVQDYPELFSDDTSPQAKEHSLEVQLPFLDNVMENDYAIVPIILGSVNPDSCKLLAETLRPWFTPDNLFVISSDFSHYPKAEDATRIDANTMEAIRSNQPDKLIETLVAQSKTGTQGLSTCLCGWNAVLTLMYLTADEPLSYQPIQYRHSGHNTERGDSDRVVGYWGIAVSDTKDVPTTVGAEEKGSFQLSETEKKTLLDLSRATLEASIKGKKRSEPPVAQLSSALKAPCGAFVTLRINGQLRGCIGRMETIQPLYKTIMDMTVSAALRDYRFSPVTPEETGRISIEISVLSPLSTIKDTSEITLGKHGILLEKGDRSGVFLPQVATETGWDMETFLGHCSRDKAGLEWNEWQSATIKTFTCLVFEEE